MVADSDIDPDADFGPENATKKLLANNVDLVWDDELVVRWWPGKEKRLFLSFTGIQRNEDDSPSHEFGKMTWARGKAHVLFITDMGRSYYSAIALRERIVSLVQQFQLLHGITAIHTIGNSMGGYGAILFSDLLLVRTCAAFVPAISLAPKITDHSDWDELRPFLTRERVDSVAPILERRVDTKFFIVFGDRTGDDRKQIKRIPDRPNVQTYVYRGIGHRVAGQLKHEGVLRPLVTATMKGNVVRTHELLCANPRILRIAGGASYKHVPEEEPAAVPGS